MIVGVLKEIKDNENRVALTPAGARVLCGAGHGIVVEQAAGSGSGLSDEAYAQAGCRIAADAAAVCSAAELILKIKEPLAREYGLFRPGQLVFTFFHFAASRQLTRAMIDSGAVCIGYETVETAAGALPLLAPMSDIAGRMAPLIAAGCLAKPAGGKGVLPCPAGHAPGARFVILGGGTAGRAAAEVASGIGAEVIIAEKNPKRLKQLKASLPGVTCTAASAGALAGLVPRADVLIGAVHAPGAQAPKLVPAELVRAMEPGSVIIDISIDQGGCIETSRPTTHSRPTYVREKVIHYCVANMPGIYPRTATLALTGATLPYVLELAGRGVAALLDGDLRQGLNIYRGRIANQAVAQAFGLPWSDARELIGL